MTIKKLAAVLLMTAAFFGATSPVLADYKTTLTLILKDGAAGANTVYDEEYTLTIPESLTITQTGWNSIGNMTVSYSGTNTGFDTSKKLVITATSTNTFTLVADGITDTIGYTVRTSGSDSAATTTFEFTAEEINTSGGTSKPIGVYVDSFSGKSNATYTDTITYTAEVQDSVTATDLSTITGAYTAQDGEVFTGTAGSEAHITVAAGATITLKNATINSIPNDEDESYKWAGITCAGDATIILECTNELKGGYEDYPGIYVPQNATLTIKGSGSLTASSNGYGAGIGGGHEIACGNIVIEGGSITATGGRYAAGIGGGYQASCGNITITDGVTSVTATKGEEAPNSIGAGYNGTCGTVTIADETKVTQN